MRPRGMAATIAAIMPARAHKGCRTEPPIGHGPAAGGVIVYLDSSRMVSSSPFRDNGYMRLPMIC